MELSRRKTMSRRFEHGVVAVDVWVEVGDVVVTDVVCDDVGVVVDSVAVVVWVLVGEVVVGDDVGDVGRDVSGVEDDMGADVAFVFAGIGGIVGGVDVSGVGVARVGGGTEDVASGLVGFGGSVGSRVDLSSVDGASVGATAVVGRSVLSVVSRA